MVQSQTNDVLPGVFVCVFVDVHAAVGLSSSLRSVLSVCVFDLAVCLYGRFRGVFTFSDVTNMSVFMAVARLLSARVCVAARGSRSAVTRCWFQPFPLLPQATLVDGAYSDEWMLLMAGRSRQTGQCSHRVHPGK